MQGRHLFAFAAAWVGLAACSANDSLFSGGEALNSSGSGGASSSNTSSPSNTSSNSSNSSSNSVSSSSAGGFGAQGGGGPGAGGSGAQGAGPGNGGGNPGCAHDSCVEGAPLAPNCDPCVTSICNEDAFCCNNTWDALCTYQVLETCGVDCNPGLPTCETQFQGTPSFVDVCGQNGEVCDIAFTTSTCNSICRAAGTECLQMFNNAMGTTCEPAQNHTCSTFAASAICLCSRGCGSGQPCTAPQSCVNGTCSN